LSGITLSYCLKKLKEAYIQHPCHRFS